MPTGGNKAYQKLYNAIILNIGQVQNIYKIYVRYRECDKGMWSQHTRKRGWPLILTFPTPPPSLPLQKSPSSWILWSRSLAFLYSFTTDVRIPIQGIAWFSLLLTSCKWNHIVYISLWFASFSHNHVWDLSIWCFQFDPKSLSLHALF